MQQTGNLYTVSIYVSSAAFRESLRYEISETGYAVLICNILMLCMLIKWLKNKAKICGNNEVESIPQEEWREKRSELEK